MTVTVRQFRSGGWEVDIRFKWPDGTQFRKRAKAPVNTKAQARRWGEELQRETIVRGKQAEEERAKAPTLTGFFPKFMKEHAEAERLKPSSIERMKSAFRVHIEPPLGRVVLDRVTNARVQQLKAAMTERSPKTVNNVLSVLSVMLNKATEWGLIAEVPCRIKLL
ncbi:MAG: site-specific integrase, partial [Polyangiaceae bacterium]|nr:site-specific integrase [Polyangiaceae bacterium]